MAEIDFEAEGLLEGLEGEAREARLRAARELADDGVELDELRTAVAEDRLALLPVERDPRAAAAQRYTAAEVAERAGIDVEFLERQWRALGLALPDRRRARSTPSGPRGGASGSQALRDGGLPDEGMLEVARLLGMTMSQLAAANRRLIADAFMQEGDTEHDAAHRFAAGGRGVPAADRRDRSPTCSRCICASRSATTRSASAELAAGRLASADEVAVCFADMVEFTKLGERSSSRSSARSPAGSASWPRAVVEPPVRLVKLIGDAAMLVGPEPGAGGRRRARAGRGGRRARASDSRCCAPGSPAGEAVPRGGDWYGRPVNLASRITGDRPAGQRARRPRRPRRARGRLRLVVRRRAAAEGDRRQRQALRCRARDGADGLSAGAERTIRRPCLSNA